MTERVTFYDIAAELHFALVAKLAHAAWEKGKRLVVRCRDEADVHALDEHLWVFRDDAFLPHEMNDGAATLADPEARVILVARDVWPPGLERTPGEILVQLAPADMAYAATFAIVIDLVDHSDEAHLEASRGRFKAWIERGLKPDKKDKV